MDERFKISDETEEVVEIVYRLNDTSDKL
jgi:hypothetical protein